MKQPKPTHDDDKLMDRLTADPSNGSLLAVLATSYEMQADFLETDFLPALFGLGSWDDRSWASRIALEKSLAELEAATVLADARPYRGRPRSLRVEMVPVPLDAGRALHAKIVLVVHEHAVRMLVGSANLTEPGYRRNREAVASLLASAAQPSQAPLLAEAVRQFKGLFGDWLTASARQCVQLALERLDGWLDGAAAARDEWFVWGGGSTPLWRQFLDHWPVNGRVKQITIVSPFWSDEGDGGPISQFVGELRKRDALSESASLRLLTEACADKSETYKPILPDSFRAFDARALEVAASTSAIDPREADASGDGGAIRRLHAKLVVLEGSDTWLAYIGSANFTRHGWGFLGDAARANIEAGLIVRRRGEAGKRLRNLLPPTTGEAVPLAGTAAGRLALPDESPAEMPWPSFLREALLAPSKVNTERLELVLTTAGATEGPWSASFLETDAASDVLFSAQAPDDGDKTHRIGLTDRALARLLIDQEVDIRWWQCPEGRAFPLNVEASARMSLPVSPGSGRPEESHLIAYYQGRITWEDLFPDPEIKAKLSSDGEPADLRGVNTSRIQSYIVREFVEALKGLNDDLKRAALAPKASMRLALLGPVSPVALARRILEAANLQGRSATAAGFQLIEILVCLDAARRLECVPRFRDDWIALVGDAARDVSAILAVLQQRFPDHFTEGFQRYASAVRGLHPLPEQQA